MQAVSLILRPTPPFDFDLTAKYLTYFRGKYGADQYQNGVYTRLLEHKGKHCLVAVRSSGAVPRPELQLEVLGSRVGKDQAHALEQKVSWLLGADAELEPFYRMVYSDPVLKPLVEKLYGLHPIRIASPFEALVLAILGQQIAASVARIVRTALIQTYGPSVNINGTVYYAFPTPDALLYAGMDGLRKIKLSARKAEYVLGIAQATKEGKLNLEILHKLPDKNIEQQITELRGVGSWTSQWFLLRGLGRQNAFPAGDLALQRLVSLAYFEGQKLSQSELLVFSQRWAPYRSYAVVYLFAAAQAGLIPGWLPKPREVGAK